METRRGLDEVGAGSLRSPARPHDLVVGQYRRLDDDFEDFRIRNGLLDGGDIGGDVFPTSLLDQPKIDHHVDFLGSSGDSLASLSGFHSAGVRA